MKRLLAILTALLLPPFLMSCLWDRDTMYEEAQENGDTLKVIVGWFDRNPDLYYSMRLDRVSKELGKDPTKLENYDDAAVSCDRLHRPLEAIEWMNKKRVQLDKSPDKDHEYRYHANIGTFYAHHWVSLLLQQRKEQISLLKQALNHIIKAIEINPDAHFGREIYQAAIINWIYEGYVNYQTSDKYTQTQLIYESQFNRLKQLYPGILIPSSYYLSNKEIEGTSGLIRLGAAWQSPDIFQILSRSLLSAEHSNLALCASLRAQEITPPGNQSINPQYHLDNTLLGSSRIEHEAVKKESISFFHKARSLADKRHNARTAYMMARLQKGIHPDTHSNFWKDWAEPDFPTPPGHTIASKYADNPNSMLLIIVIALIVFLILYNIYYYNRKAREKTRRKAQP